MTDLTDFMALAAKRTKHLVLMGAAAQRFGEAAKAAGVGHITFADSMEEAVRTGYELAEPGDIVLLSPACSSFDWYHCFEERGDDFKHKVQSLASSWEGTAPIEGAQ